MSYGRFDPDSVRVLFADCGEEAGSGNNWVLTGAGTISTMPYGFIPYPSLQFHGHLKFVYSGTINVTAAAANPNHVAIGFRLLDNGGAVSGVPAPALEITAPTTGSGRFILEADLFINGSHSGSDDITMRQTLTVVNAAETENTVQRYYQIITTLSQKADHKLGFSATVAVNGTAALSDFTVRSALGLHFCPRSVS